MTNGTDALELQKVHYQDVKNRIEMAMAVARAELETALEKQLCPSSAVPRAILDLTVATDYGILALLDGMIVYMTRLQAELHARTDDVRAVWRHVVGYIITGILGAAIATAIAYITGGGRP